MPDTGGARQKEAPPQRTGHTFIRYNGLLTCVDVLDTVTLVLEG